MSIKYNGFTIDEHPGTEFGRPKFKKYGKEIDIQEYIEANREDTEIYPCLEKYGCLKPLERTPSEIYGDFTEYNDLRGNLDKAIKSQEMWDQLPSTIKNEFNNDMHEFIDRGMEWAQRQIKTETETPAEQPTEQPKGE